MVDWIARRVPLKSVQDLMSTLTKIANHGHRILKEYRQLPHEEQQEYRVFHELNEDATRLGYKECVLSSSIDLLVSLMCDCCSSTIISEIVSLLAAGG